MTKNEINPLLMSLFRPGEKRVFASTFGESARYELSQDIPASEPLTVVTYESRAGIIRDRLDLMGFSLDLAREAFERGRRRELDSFEEMFRQFAELNPAAWHSQLKFAALRSMSFDDWMRGFKYIVDHDVKRFRWSTEPTTVDYPFPVEYMLREPDEDFLGFPAFDTRISLRAALEAVDAETVVTQDLTDLIAGGWFDTDQELIAHADDLITADFATTQRIVVLTEGASDRKALDSALRLRRPHLRDYFSFIDFDELRVPGGAGSVINFVKAFVGAGIVNRVIAILDNDTGAKSALRGLRGIDLPPNVRVVQLPPLEMLGRYPTLGPTGISQTDVNGLAATIELYFGEDILRDEGGQLTPVQWRGYDDALKQYQGEVLGKPTLQSKFSAKIEAATAGKSSETMDWQGIDAVLDAICGAFKSARPSDWETGIYW